MEYPLDEGIKIRIVQDDCAENPVQESYSDSPVQVSIWHRKYDFGNNADFKTPEDFRDFCKEQRENGDQVFRLPVFLYDHSGLTVNTTGFSCPWDSGQVGYCWILASEARRYFDVETEEKILEILHSTVELLDDYLTGNVWGFQILGKDGEELDACYGFYGDPDDCVKDSKVTAEHHVEVAKKARLEYETRRQR
jgi:hypothetical protein